MTPDEIKKGLACASNCSDNIDGCKDCPYTGLDCPDLHPDAIALIQQLEAENTRRHDKIIQLYNDLEGLRNIIATIVTDSKATYKQLEAQVPRWISVEERLPERGVCKACLVYAEEFTRVADWSCDRYGDDWWFYVDGEYEPLITHWMPLPEPPKETAP